MKTLSIDIRQARQEDAEQIAQVHIESWRGAYSGIIPSESLNRMLSRRGTNWWQNAIKRAASVLIIELDGKIVGYATYGRNRANELKQQGEIYELYIEPVYQGLGLGTRLFKAAMSALKNHSLKGLVVWVLDENDIAQNFYRNIGGFDYAEGVEVFDSKALKKIAYVWK